VFFNTQAAAAAAAQCSIFPEGAEDAFRVVGAPGPEEVSSLAMCWARSGFSVHACYYAWLQGTANALIPKEVSHLKVKWPH